MGSGARAILSSHWCSTLFEATPPSFFLPVSRTGGRATSLPPLRGIGRCDVAARSGRGGIFCVVLWPFLTQFQEKIDHPAWANILVEIPLEENTLAHKQEAMHDRCPFHCPCCGIQKSKHATRGTDRVHIRRKWGPRSCCFTAMLLTAWVSASESAHCCCCPVCAVDCGADEGPWHLWNIINFRTRAITEIEVSSEVRDSYLF